MKNQKIYLQRVRVHNLKGVDLELEPGTLTVFTGVSGSGKSSLAFDTLFAEGQRRYVESLSTFARRQLGEMAKPDFEYATGISPTISIEQKTAGRNPRSTVGTLTEIYDHLRVLFARVAIPHCPVSKEPVAPQSRERIIKTVQNKPEGKRLIILTPFARARKAEFKDDFQDFLRKGYTRIRLDGAFVELGDDLALDGSVAHDVDIVVDRLVVSEENKSRIAEAMTSALQLGNGLCSIFDVQTEEEELFSMHAFSPKSGLSYGPLEPQDFSFNSPAGMCPRCQGMGIAWNEESGTQKTCPKCKGSRLKPYPAAALFQGKKIQEITAFTIGEAAAFFNAVQLNESDTRIAEELLKEIRERLHFLIDVGLHYLTLDRTAPTLSGGEAQRVRLASQIGCGLVGITYILDEPSIGLHPRDNKKLVHTLKHLRDMGNTVIVVEHDDETIWEADRVVDFGPGPGVLGGEIVVNGTLSDLIQNERSLTGQYLTGKLSIPIRKKRRKPAKDHIEIVGATHHNLKNISVKIPLSIFIAVTGVSGSGKSSLISDILYPALSNALHDGEHTVGAHKAIKGIDGIDKIIAITQTPIGRTPRSNPATYIKLFDEIRDLYASLPESKARGYLPGRFSFNVKEGSCPNCSGMGMVKIDMDFMEDAWIECPECLGKRFDPETLSVFFKGKTIFDVLDMEVHEALEFFANIPSIQRKLDTLKQVGLEYIKLGQSSTTLSGGEAQRIKLAKELARPSTGRTLYILDEPTTGLHFHDIKQLLEVLHVLVDKGNTVLVIEHNMDVVKTADWIIDIGPDGGAGGGEIVATGTPESISKMDTPTGQAVFDALNPRTKERVEAAIEKSKRSKQEAGLREKARIHEISVYDAEQNNLKGITVHIPREKITVCTGPSGSGKTSLAFDTIYAEGQRRYIESLSPYARQFVQQMPKPKVGRVEGLSPAIAIEQKKAAGNPRSTVGTLTEVYDYLRILFARLGIPHCPQTGEVIKTISKEFVVERILELPEGERVQILAPIEVRKTDRFEDIISRLKRQGFLRIRLNDAFFDLDQEEPIPFDRKRKNELYLVIDRLKINQTLRHRLFEAVENAARYGNNKLVAALDDKDLFFNLAFAVESTGKSYPEITPHTFAFNTAEGMCPDCLGLGYQYGANLSSKREILSVSIRELMEQLWGASTSKQAELLLEFVMKEEGIAIDLPIDLLGKKEQDILFKGSLPDKWYKLPNGLFARWPGLEPVLAKIGKHAKSGIKDVVLPWLNEQECPACTGFRINKLAQNVRLQSLSIGELCRLPIEQSAKFIESLAPKVAQDKLLCEVLDHLMSRLRFLIDVGLHYMALERKAPSLSGGEAQRIRLARQLGTGLTGVLYVLDEPTIGLHARDTAKLNAALDKLKELGNTLILVEHDLSTIARADYVLDFGPKSGEMGGHITAKGSVKELMQDDNSLTGRYLSGKETIDPPKKKRIPIALEFQQSRRLEFKSAKAAAKQSLPEGSGDAAGFKGQDADEDESRLSSHHRYIKGKAFLEVAKARLHNLKNITVKFPVGLMTCLTGVSGSGKSTLLNDILLPAVTQGIGRTDTVTLPFATVSGISNFDQIISIDQNPVGQTVRSDVCTYSNVLTPIREFFTQLPESKIRGLEPKHFSYNHRKGMCTHCWGLGYRRIQMHFLPEVKITCEECLGMRLNPVSLEVVYKGKNLGQWLDTTVNEAYLTFQDHPRIKRIMDTLIAVGLGYLKLGQEVQSLSGGEAQRIKLSRELAKRSTGNTLYLLDEPTTGLHSEDIKKLLAVLHQLMDKGNTIIVIEHHLSVVRHADWVIDLGPEAGDLGGEVLFSGPPEQISRCERSWTGQCLAEHFVHKHR